MDKDIWFTSDLHFYHAGIIGFCDRPWTAETQTQELIKRWNNNVGLMDEVYHLGDFAWAGPKKINQVLDIIRSLNGRIHFILGNHDNPTLWNLIESANLSHVESICNYKEIKYQGHKIVLSHYAFREWNGAYRGSWNLFGHSHATLNGVGKQMDVGIDAHPEFRPFHIDEIREILSKKPIKIE